MIVLAFGFMCSGVWGCGGAGGDSCGVAGGAFFDGSGSGSGDSGGNNSGGSSSSPANAVRANVAGDSFNYAVTGHYSQTGGAQKVSTSGTSSQTYTASTFGGQTSLLDSVSTVLAINGAQTTFLDAEQLSSTEVMLGQSDNGTMQAVTGGAFSLPANLTSSTALNATETLANGTVVTVALKVVGAASVTTPAGTFASWQITKTATYSDGTTSKDDLDFAPTIGAAVQAHHRNTYANGMSDSLTFTLSKYTLGGS